MEEGWKERTSTLTRRAARGSPAARTPCGLGRGSGSRASPRTWAEARRGHRTPSRSLLRALCGGTG
eukprot:5167817-Pyramimonas_sp.AAC.1